MIINLFGDSFIYGSCADYHEDGRKMNIDYWLTEKGWSVSNYGYNGSSNTEVLSCIKENPFNEECLCVVGVTSLLRENLPWLGFSSSWGRNILKEDRFDHPNLENPMSNELWEDYLIYCHDDEYFNTIYKIWLLKVKHLLDNTPNVKGYLFVNTVEKYKKPMFVEKENYLYTDSSITDMLVDKEDEKLFEGGLTEETFLEGRAHPSTLGYKLVAEDIHDIFHNT